MKKIDRIKELVTTIETHQHELERLNSSILGPAPKYPQHPTTLTSYTLFRANRIISIYTEADKEAWKVY